MLKRLLDVAASALVLLLLSPVFLLIACAVVLDSGRPVLFRQDRVGRGFRRFSIWKFRSMRAHTPGATVTAAGDPRITRVGRILRAAKLDELPQFWNILRGDMSLVGPRPEVLEYVEMYKDRYRRILQVRPGITDLASIRFRDEEGVLAASGDPVREYIDHVLPQKLDLADEYLRRQSLLLDFTILLQTFRVVLLKNPGL